MTYSDSDDKEQLVIPAGVTISVEMVNKIRAMNEGNPSYDTYCKRLEDVFNLPRVSINENKKLFLGGFVEGEGSVSVSIKKNKGTKFGIEIDPLFNITQSLNGVNHLQLAHAVLRVGRIRYKSGSDKTLSFVVEPRQSLENNVVPFYKKYVYPYSSRAKQIKFDNFCKMLDLFNQKAHLDADRLIYEVLPLWDAMREQKSIKQTFPNLDAAQRYVKSQIKS